MINGNVFLQTVRVGDDRALTAVIFGRGVSCLDKLIDSYQLTVCNVVTMAMTLGCGGTRPVNVVLKSKNRPK